MRVTEISPEMREILRKRLLLSLICILLAECVRSSWEADDDGLAKLTDALHTVTANPTRSRILKDMLLLGDPLTEVLDAQEEQDRGLMHPSTQSSMDFSSRLELDRDPAVALGDSDLQQEQINSVVSRPTALRARQKKSQGAIQLASCAPGVHQNTSADCTVLQQGARNPTLSSHAARMATLTARIKHLNR